MYVKTSDAAAAAATRSHESGDDGTCFGSWLLSRPQQVVVVEVKTEVVVVFGQGLVMV